MARCRSLVLFCFVFLGCHTVVPLEPESRPVEMPFWEQGQLALSLGQPGRAIALFGQSLTEEQRGARNHLGLAAAHLETGDEDSACSHLGQYLASHPDHWILRAHHAELLMRLGRFSQARAEWERFIAAAQEEEKLLVRRLLNSHGRLLELAEELGDEYQIHLHRGIGLLLLAQWQAELKLSEPVFSWEALLCKAIADLTHAQEICPHEARPAWYLHVAWKALGQAHLAQRWLRQAAAAAPFTYLTPVEQRKLGLVSGEW